MSDLTTEVLEAVRTNPSVAERVFAMQIAQGVIDDETNDALLRAAGIDPDVSPWPLEDITYDYYDSSFEFKGVREGWEPTLETLEKWWALGFAQCWICYADGPNGERREKHYAPSARGGILSGLKQLLGGDRA